MRTAASAPLLAAMLLLHAGCCGIHAVPLHAAKPLEWSDCGGGATVLTVNGVALGPDPVRAGGNFTLSLDCTSVDSIRAGTFVTEVFLAGVPVHKETDDLCSKAVCPVAVGKTVIKTVTFMPGITPRGRYRIQLTGFLPDGLPDICAEIFFDVVS